MILPAKMHFFQGDLSVQKIGKHCVISGVFPLIIHSFLKEERYINLLYFISKYMVNGVYRENRGKCSTWQIFL